MLNQLRVIWTSYATRKINWVLFLLGSFLMVIAWNATDSMFHRVTPQKSTSWLNRGSLDVGYRHFTMDDGTPAVTMTDDWDWSEWNIDLDVLRFTPAVDPSYPDPWDLSLIHI